ncbi:MAG: hypothetical protein ABII00_04035 [Elusimicrobiota bacterium]
MTGVPDGPDEDWFAPENIRGLEDEAAAKAQDDRLAARDVFAAYHALGTGRTDEFARFHAVMDELEAERYASELAKLVGGSPAIRAGVILAEVAPP